MLRAPGPVGSLGASVVVRPEDLGLGIALAVAAGASRTRTEKRSFILKIQRVVPLTICGVGNPFETKLWRQWKADDGGDRLIWYPLYPK
jgi:hypothetical protein